MTTDQAAAEVIKHFEGYRSTPYWDVNAYRLGYGSDTIELPNGTHRKVVQGDVTTVALATKDLIRRVHNEFLPTVANQIGEPYWSNLPVNAQAALISIGYNYGHITRAKIITAARTGDLNQLADAILETTIGDNGGINDKRRRAEAELVRTAKLNAIKGADKTAIYIIGGTAALAGITLVSIWLYNEYKK